MPSFSVLAESEGFLFRQPWPSAAYVLSGGFRNSGFQTVVARASRPCVGRTIRTGGMPVPLRSFVPKQIQLRRRAELLQSLAFGAVAR